MDIDIDSSKMDASLHLIDGFNCSCLVIDVERKKIPSNLSNFYSMKNKITTLI